MKKQKKSSSTKTKKKSVIKQKQPIKKKSTKKVFKESKKVFKESKPIKETKKQSAFKNQIIKNFEKLRKEKIKIVIQSTLYETKKTKGKKSYKHKNKNGVETITGLNRAGHKFKEKIESVKSKKDIERIFKQLLKDKVKGKKRRTATMKVIMYTGKFIKKSGKIVNGEKKGVYYFNVSKTKSKKVINRTISVEEIINTLDLIDQMYKGELDEIEGIIDNEASLFFN